MKTTEATWQDLPLHYFQGATEEGGSDESGDLGGGDLGGDVGGDLGGDEADTEAAPASGSAKSGEIRDPQKVYELLKRTQTELKQYRAKAKAFADLTPEEVKELREFKQRQTIAQKEAEEKELELKGQYAALYDKKLGETKAEFERTNSQLQRRIQALEKEKQSLFEQLTGETTRNKTMQIRGQVMDAFFANGGLKGDSDEGAEAFFRHIWNDYKDRFDLTDEGLRILSSNGKELAVDEEGNPLDLNGFMESLKGRKSTRMFFEGLRPEGTDTPASSKPKTPTAVQGKPREISPADLKHLGKLGISLEDIQTGKVRVRP